MPADAGGQVHVLGLEAHDLAAKDVGRRLVVLGWDPEDLDLPLIPAMDRIGQVEVDEGGLDEPGVTFVLGLAERRGIRGLEVVGRQRSLRGQVVAKWPAIMRVIGDVGAPSPGRSLPELTSLRVGAILRRADAARVGSPWSGLGDRDGVVGCDIGPIEGLAVRPERLGPESERFTPVLGRRSPTDGAARVDGEDRHRLAKLPQAGDEASTRQRSIVGMGGDEDVGHRGRG